MEREQEESEKIDIHLHLDKSIYFTIAATICIKIALYYYGVN
jgi:hypothetical protein